MICLYNLTNGFYFERYRMSSFPISPNDEALQRLRIDNAKPASTPRIASLSSVRSVPEMPRTPPQAPARLLRAERRRGERRSRQERRRRRQPVLLDTRSRRERRKRPGHRAADRASHHPTLYPRGIDETA